ncbi:MAG: response regulator, partial [Ferruginibacter sp.]|nr:response regulator [Ferruginibacter sp.]
MSAPLKILILEDSDIDALVIQHLLNRSNLQCQFHLAMDEREFIDALNNFKPHVILSDNSLPQFNAMEALQIVQRHLLHIPFILVTGFVSEEYAANIIKLGADDYLLKDRLSRLPVAINAALKQKEIEKEKWKVEKDNQLKAGLLNTIGQAVMATDIKGIIQYWNKAAEKIYGWSVEEAMGKNAAELIPAQQTAEAAM